VVSKIVGILGGMGPEATVDFMSKIIKHTQVKSEQEHLRILVDNNPQVPDRTKAIIGNGQTPGPVLAKMAQSLESWGADILAIPCNTAHYFLEEIKKKVRIPIVNMIEETVKVLVHNKVSTVALLATNGTIKTGLYHEVFQQAGIQLVLPEDIFQEKVMDAIYAVKSGDYELAHSFKQEIIDHVISKGATSIILGCTELPLLFGTDDSEVVFFDPTEILAKAIIKKCRDN